MSDLNKKILQALKNDIAANEFSEEQANTLQLMKQSFQGTFKISFIAIVIIQFIFAGLAVYSGYQMIGEVEIGLKINWLAGTLLAIIALAVARLWFFMELNRLSIIREVKRVELQVSLLAEQKQD